VAESNHEPHPFPVILTYFLSGLSGPSLLPDSGDLIASIHVLALPIPRLCALYPARKTLRHAAAFGNVAYRVNVLSAFFGAATVVVLWRILHHRQAVSRPAAAAIAALFATAPAVVTLSRVAEMYTLASFLAAVMVACLLSEDPRGGSWALLGLGLGLSVHRP